VITYNTALNRPAYQSSVFSRDYGTFSAHYANDGSRHTTWNTDPYCAATNVEANPWWAVDLGQPMSVYGMDLTTSDQTRRKTYIIGLDLLDL